jgi:hypothetical protein
MNGTPCPSPHSYYYLQRVVILTGWAAQPSEDIQYKGAFTRAEKPPEDIKWRLFLMNIKGLTFTKPSPF